MNDRRSFIRQAGLAGLGLLSLPDRIFAVEPGAEDSDRLTILHTNDVHSRLEAFPRDGTSMAGRGGVAARAALIGKIRKESKHILLLDAGDIFQGTPYFNLFNGEPEIRAMQWMGYDAAIMGNHDFDAGIDNFTDKLSRFGRFPIVMSNYDFSGTSMEGKYLPYKVFQKGRIRVGLTGVGIELKGLVPGHLFGNTKYLDPVRKANESAYILKKKKACDFVICLSHLGDMYNDNKVSDEILAKESEYIDLIIGGHTHRFFEKPRVYRNRLGREVLVNQVGWAGVRLGRLDFNFSAHRGRKLESDQSIVIEQQGGE